MNIVVRVDQAMGHGEGRRYDAINHEKFVLEGHGRVNALRREGLDGGHDFITMNGTKARGVLSLYKATIASLQQVAGRSLDELAGLCSDADEVDDLGVSAMREEYDVRV